jgi:hypothetical protein
VHRTVYFNRDRGVAQITAIGDARGRPIARSRVGVLNHGPDRASYT